MTKRTAIYVQAMIRDCESQALNLINERKYFKRCVDVFIAVSNWNVLSFWQYTSQRIDCVGNFRRGINLFD